MQFAGTIEAPLASAFNLAKERSRGMHFMPQSGARISRSGGRCSSAARMRAATTSGVYGSGSPMLMTPKITVLSPSPSSVVRSGLGWVASIEICSTLEPVSSEPRRARLTEYFAGEGLIDLVISCSRHLPSSPRQ